MIGDREVMLTSLEGRKANVTPALATDPIPETLERPRKVAAGEVSRQPQGERTSSLTW